MPLFLLFFLASYALVQYYVYRTVIAALVPGRTARLCCVALLVLTAAGPLVMRSFLSLGLPVAARMTGTVTYAYMGAAVIFLPISLALRLASRILPGRPLAGRRHAIAAVILTVATCLYAYIEANSPVVEHTRIRDARIARPLRIVFISDLHEGLTVRPRFVRNVIDTVKAERPDLLLCGGDLVEIGAASRQENWRLWREIAPPLGMYTVLGNHELYSGFGESVELLRDAGFTVLEETGLSVGGITLLGVSDEEFFRRGLKRRPDMAAVRRAISPSQFAVLLRHRPITEPTVTADLQLSGHTHNGQIFPYSFIPKLIFGHVAGLYRTDAGLLYVSRGTGTWGPRMRLGSRPEISVLELMP